LQESPILQLRVGNVLGVVRVQLALARLARERKEVAEARRLYVEAVRSARSIAAQAELSGAVESLAELAAADQPVIAVRLAGASAAMRDHASAGGSSALPPWLAGVRRRLGEDAFSDVWAEGRTLSVDDASEQAIDLATLAPTIGASAAPVSAGGLTPRQLEIALLIARGLTSREVAAQLILSERTVDSHLENILGRLRLHSRKELSLWAARQGLLASAE
jgi:DNA-binding CsgD family transcriptional regulator